MPPRRLSAGRGRSDRGAFCVRKEITPPSEAPSGQGGSAIPTSAAETSGVNLVCEPASESVDQVIAAGERHTRHFGRHEMRADLKDCIITFAPVAMRPR